MSAQEQWVPSIEGYAILLPTILSVMYGQGEWPEDSVSEFYGKLTCCWKMHLTLLDCTLSVKTALMGSWHFSTLYRFIKAVRSCSLCCLTYPLLPLC